MERQPWCLIIVELVSFSRECFKNIDILTIFFYTFNFIQLSQQQKKQPNIVPWEGHWYVY